MDTRGVGERDADEVSFDAFVGVRSAALLRSAYLLTGDAGKAEDLLQTALAKVWPRWRQVNRHGDGEAYVRRVLYTTYVNWWRRRWNGETPVSELPEHSDGQDAYDVVDQRAVVLEALAELPRRQRAIVVLRYFEDRTEAETARILGCSVGTVKSQNARALARLRGSPLLTATVEEDR